MIYELTDRIIYLQPVKAYPDSEDLFDFPIINILFIIEEKQHYLSTSVVFHQSNLVYELLLSDDLFAYTAVKYDCNMGWRFPFEEKVLSVCTSRYKAAVLFYCVVIKYLGEI